MKKLMYLAAALLVLVACDNQGNNAPERTPFKKGQQVTLTVGSANQGSQAPARTMSGVRNDDNIAFTWEEGDKILVKVGQESAVFTLSSEPGLEYGEFAGTMPADGSTFDIQYPTTTPDLSAQVYTTDKTIPADKMLFTATDCTLDAPATLAAQYAMVQLNLYGTNITIGKIVLTNTTADPVESYTLTCTDGKTIGATSAEATPFYMVVPTGAYKFEVEVYDNAATPAMICSFATSEAKNFEVGGCLNMPAKEVKAATMHNGHEYVDLGLPSGLKWATMNVGATAPEGYGDYFAWGETAPHQDNDYSEMAYTYKDNPTTLPLDHDAAAVNWGGDWRMPTKAEQDELLNNCTWTWTEDYNNTGIKGCIVTSQAEGNNNSIFLPASGYCNGPSPSLIQVGFTGSCWSSSRYEDDSDSVYYLWFLSSKKGESLLYRNAGNPVRPVCK